MADIKVKKDPNNPNTVILSGWPTEKEKTESFKKSVDSARAGKAKKTKVVEEVEEDEGDE